MDIGIRLETASFEILSGLLESGELSSQDLTRAYLERIEALNRQVNAVIEINPDAMAIAEALDAERARGETRGPLHGLPILIKDNIDTADKMTTTAGSLALEGSIAPVDAVVVQRLRAAGVILLGKSNLSEWANIRSTKATTGWSSRGGQTRNPYSLNHSPGGSSSGSGVAASLGFCAAAVGTETDGSVVIPSAMNALAGIKPSLGRVSRSGIIPIGHSQDTAGPMATCVRDAALLLQGMMGSDPDDAITTSSPGLSSDYPPLDKSALRGARIGMVENYRGLEDGVESVIEEAIAALRDCGAEVIEGVELEGLDQLGELDTEVMLYELKHDLNAYLTRLGSNAPVRDLSDIIAFNERHAERTMPHFGQEYFCAAEDKGDLTEQRYLDALSQVKRMTGKEGIDAALTRHKLDALAARTIGPPWVIDLINGDKRSPCASTWAALSGYPSISVPAGYVDDLPLGLLFFAENNSEAKLIGYGYAFEQATQARRPPPLGDAD